MTAFHLTAYFHQVPSLVDITQDEDPCLRIGVRPLKDIPCTQYNDTEGTRAKMEASLNISIKQDRSM